jgi:hypothetical protein
LPSHFTFGSIATRPADRAHGAVRLMRPQRKFSRREIQSFKLDVKKLLKHGTEDELMRYLRGIEIFDEDPRFAKAVAVYRALKKGKL